MTWKGHEEVADAVSHPMKDNDIKGLPLKGIGRGEAFKLN